MLQTSNGLYYFHQLMEYSVFTVYLLNHLDYLVVTGFLSYNIPLVFKLKSERGYLIRAGIMALMSFAIIPVVMFVLPVSNNSYGESGSYGGGHGLSLLLWGFCFLTGIIFASYGARTIQAKFALLFSRFTVKSGVRKGTRTDIRYMDKELPQIANYNPLKFINLKKGVFVGLDENRKPIYLSGADDWYKRHFLIVGATRSGKGVAMQYLGIQSLMLGETVVFLDPKGDKYMPHIFKAKCNELGLAYNYIDLTNDTPQINLIADFTDRDLKNCFVEAFSQRELGSESDVYRKNEQEFLELLSSYIVDSCNCEHEADDENKKSLAKLCNEFNLARHADKYKSSVSDLNKLCKIESINASNGKSLTELFNGGGCIYIVGDLLDETMKKIQRFIFCRIVQLARNYANFLESNYGSSSSGLTEKHITVFADELVAHISKFVAESYTVSLGWGLKIISAIQDLKLLRGAPAGLDVGYLTGAIFANSQNKLFYRADDIETADFLSDMTGKIQIEDEQKLVTRNAMNSEKLDRQTRLSQSERNYFDRNMILKLRQFEAIFCASLSNRSAIASLCKTSPVIIKDDDNNQVNGKQIIEVARSSNNLSHGADDSSIEFNDYVEFSHIRSNNLGLGSNKNQQSTQTNRNNATGEFNNEYTSNNSRNDESNNGKSNDIKPSSKKNSTRKSNYLF